ncbi:trypsin-like serine protease [Aliivibrio salmonicida]|uniref:trypsin-like serine protease n=1 Tax=Aliivibrio salmonicida TaxID=40269 RepID=UPI003D114B12
MKITNITLFMAGLSFNAIAIENGTSVNWNDHNDIIKLYSSDEIQSCSGTLIAGKYVLTAAHCLISNNPIVKITSATGKKENIISQNTHTGYYDATNGGSENWHDVAVSELSNYVDTKQIHFFANQIIDKKNKSDDVQVFGFGATYENLNYATFSIVDLEINPQDRLDSSFINQGNTIGGDSGSAWLINNKIVAVHKGGDWIVDVNENETRETYSTNLHYSNDFILETINGWHYPTLANTSNGSATITVQSLHLNPYSDTANYSGDVVITGGTCLGITDIQPFKTCTYIIESQGGEGQLLLSNNEVITINKPIPEATPPLTPSNDDDSGGSLGFLSLIALLGLTLIRRK